MRVAAAVSARAAVTRARIRRARVRDVGRARAVLLLDVEAHADLSSSARFRHDSEARARRGAVANEERARRVGGALRDRPRRAGCSVGAMNSTDVMVVIVGARGSAMAMWRSGSEKLCAIGQYALNQMRDAGEATIICL